MKSSWKVITVMLVGIAIIAATIIVHQSKPNNTGAWGLKNSVQLLAGIILIFSAFLYRKDNFLGRLVNTKTGRIHLFSAILGSFIVLIYIWVISIGTWTSWPPTTNYYNMLANAFSHGMLHLEAPPSPALLALKDPYLPKNREGIPVIWDLSLYKGEYYLYWGPVPALLLAILKPFSSTPVPDNVLTFIFMVGLLIFQIMLVLNLRRNYFQEISSWVILLSISFIGLINPILYMLLEPRIYEASLVSGQFFFVGGVYWLFSAFTKPSAVKLCLAGIFLALAVGSRSILLFPIAFLVIVELVWVIKSHPAKAVIFTSAMTLPLVLGAVCYAWYNYARFDSLTEFGLSYQLTQTDIHQTLNESFSLAYAPPNLFKLLVNPFETKPAFPYIKATAWGGPAWFKNYNPEIYDYFAEDITGILVGSPFLLFVLLAAAWNEKNLRWITASLAGSSIILFGTLLFFFYLTMRYLLDLLPVLSLLACIGFWKGTHFLQSKRTAKYLYSIAGIGLWAYSISISFILCYSSNMHRIRIYNPDLIQKITWAFTHFYK
jgi:hypothetical protein